MIVKKYMLRESNFHALQEAGLMNENHLTEMFSKIYEFYSQSLMFYLDKELELSKREEEIENCILSIKPVKDAEKDAYQSLSFLKFFYLRNNLKIERIPKELLTILEDRVRNKQTIFDSTIEDIIKQTVIEVIKNTNYPDGTNINYGPSSSMDYFAPNNAIVLGLRMNPEYEKDTKENPDWFKNYLQKEALLKILREKVMDDAREKLPKDIPLFVIEYHEGSVTKDF